MVSDLNKAFFRRKNFIWVYICGRVLRVVWRGGKQNSYKPDRETRYESENVFNFLISSYSLIKDSLQSKEGPGIVTYQMELFGIKINGFQPLTNVQKHKEFHIRCGRAPRSTSGKIFFKCIT